MANYYVAYTKSITHKYKAAVRSNVTVFLVFNSIFCFVLPFIFAYNSNGFWIKENSFREQPMVKFKYQYLIILEAKTTNSHFSMICSTYHNLISKAPYSDNCSLMKVIEVDENEDGKIDKMKMTLHITNVSSFDIDSFHLMLIFDYKLHGECILSMEAVAAASYIFSQPIGRLDIISELGADFKKPLFCHVKHHKQNHTTILSGISEQKNKIDAMYKIVSQYASNNMNVHLKKVHYSKRFKSETADNEPLIITADIRYAEQEIIYKTRFWQLIKWAWIQYFSILALFMYLSRKMKKFVFQNRILQTIKIDPMEELQS